MAWQSSSSCIHHFGDFFSVTDHHLLIAGLQLTGKYRPTAIKSCAESRQDQLQFSQLAKEAIQDDGNTSMHYIMHWCLYKFSENVSLAWLSPGSSLPDGSGIGRKRWSEFKKERDNRMKDHILKAWKDGIRDERPQSQLRQRSRNSLCKATVELHTISALCEWSYLCNNYQRA